MRNPLLDMYQAQLEASRHIADVILTNTEKLDHLMFSTARVGVADQFKYAQSLGAARDADGVKTLQSAFNAHAPDTLMNYYRDVFKVFADANAEVGKAAETFLEDMKSAAITAGDGAARELSGVAGPIALTGPNANFVNLWTSAYQQFADITKQYMESASKGVNVPVTAPNESSPKRAARKVRGSRH
jgi:phasin family protein